MYQRFVAAAVIMALIAGCSDDEAGGGGDLGFDTAQDALDALDALDVSGLEDTGGGVTVPDASDTGGAQDVTSGDAVTPGSFGAPCNGNSDCLSGFCVEGPDGYVCTQTCELDCPSGFDCKGVSSSGPDVVFLCVPRVKKLCAPCTSDQQCPDGACLTLDGEQRCGYACEADDECPKGFGCLADPSAAHEGAWCQPVTGSCDCTEPLSGSQRTCVAENDFGACYGVETCDPEDGWVGCTASEPKGETCNGKDDDCDGLVDEQVVAGAPCENTVDGVGSCAGLTACMGPLGLVCQGSVPAPEVCDFNDNDCDGVKDEDYTDGDGYFTLDAHCGTCGNDCVTKIAHGTGRCGGTPAQPVCVVDSCEEDYVAVNDFQCALPPDVSCTPCISDASCFGGSCVVLDGQQVCMGPCGDAASSCKEGYACEEQDGVKRCVPATGSCVCTTATDGLTRSCKASNEFGFCYGEETCDAAVGWSGCTALLPAVETCNGIDDDCDGSVDDGVAPPPEACESSTDTGTCTGQWYCGDQGDGVKWWCSAAVPGAEICDYLDNDCDGLVDQGFLDPASGTYVNDAHCGACGVTCAGKIPNATSTCAPNEGTPRCEVKQCNPGTYQAGPLTCLPVSDALCTPCQTDANCPTPGDACIPLDGGSFCGRDCGAGNLHGKPEGECPGGYACVASGEGKQCRPVSGSCSCLPDDAGATRPCLQSNAHGTCYGAESCDPQVGWAGCSAQVPAKEVCNGKDDDCNLAVDDVPGRGAPCANANGFGSCAGVQDCVAGEQALVCKGETPAAEKCNGKDDDCDGATDEGFPNLFQSCSTGAGVCQGYGFYACTADGAGTACNAVAGMGGAESCDGLDNDCDGAVDEGYPGLGTVCTAGQGACKASGTLLCKPDGTGTKCSAVVLPVGTETCNGIDDDCDGSIDEALTGPKCPKQQGVCVNSAQACGGLDGWRACTGPEYGAKYEPVEITCDGLDNDCDGATDDNLPAQPCSNQKGVCAGSFAKCGGASGFAACGAAQYGPDYQATESTCDSLDNDCDGQTDEGWKNQTSGKYDSNKACGSCFTDCTAIFARPNAYGVCSAAGAPTCKMVCCAKGAGGVCDGVSSWFDLNGVPDDGCELKLDPQAIYVSIDDANGDDLAGCGRGPVGTGAANRPCRTIKRGIQEAVATGRVRVLVADGLYVETVTVSNGISLLGGYRSDNWERHLTTTLTTIRGTTGTGTHDQTVIATGITLATTIEGFTIEGQDNTKTGGNSYAVYVSGSNGNLAIKSNVVVAGTGGPGSSKAAASNGTKGTDGKGRSSPGVTASTYDAFIATGTGYCNPSNNRSHTNGGALTCSGTDVSGGHGGGNRCEPDPNGGEYSAIDGLSGKTGAGGGSAGSGGDAGDDGFINGSQCFLPTGTMAGAPGTNGAAGASGTAGSGCSAGIGAVSGGHWAGGAGSGGTAGKNGGGGGGGGAGGGGYCYSCAESKDRLGGHGGGGGSGGCGGAGGQSGTAGGASFAIFIVGGSAPAVSGNLILRGAGGRGGDGGNGGVGGAGGHGGDGGLCPGNCFCHTEAGKGGEGGSAGHGGGGGGGCGGGTFGIFTSGVGTPTYCGAGSGNTISGGIAGPGGLGGLSLGATGSNGSNGPLSACSFN